MHAELSKDQLTYVRERLQSSRPAGQQQGLNPGVFEEALTSLPKLNANAGLFDECARWQGCLGPTRADVVMFERRKSNLHLR